MAGRIKKKDHENLSEENIKRVIGLLEAEKPITKKAACEILNISYNTTRLNKIIEEYKQEQILASKKRKENRGKPASDFEKQTIVEQFLDGESIATISKRIYRSTEFVRNVLEDIGVPQKPVGATYTQAGFVPDNCVRDEFDLGSVVWNCKKHCMAIVINLETNVRNPEYNYYRVYNIEPIEETSPYFPQYTDYGGYYDGAYAYDLAYLDHLKEYGVDVYKPYRSTFSNWLKDG